MNHQKETCAINFFSALDTQKVVHSGLFLQKTFLQVHLNVFSAIRAITAQKKG